MKKKEEQALSMVTRKKGCATKRIGHDKCTCDLKMHVTCVVVCLETRLDTLSNMNILTS